MVSNYGRITMLETWKGPRLAMHGAPQWHLLIVLFMLMSLVAESVALKLSGEQSLVISVAIKLVDDLLHHPSVW